jgi:hypothetical protein
VGQPTITGLVDVNENNIYTDDFWLLSDIYQKAVATI